MIEDIEAWAEAIVKAKQAREKEEQNFQHYAAAVNWLTSAQSIEELEGVKDEINKHSLIWVAEYSKWADLLDKYYRVMRAALSTGAIRKIGS